MVRIKGELAIITSSPFILVILSSTMNRKILIASTIIWMGLLSCRPVIAIGWREILLVAVLVLFLLGPPIYRFLQKFENYRRQKDK